MIRKTRHDLMVHEISMRGRNKATLINVTLEITRGHIVLGILVVGKHTRQSGKHLSTYVFEINFKKLFPDTVVVEQGDRIRFNTLNMLVEVALNERDNVKVVAKLLVPRSESCFVSLVTVKSTKPSSDKSSRFRSSGNLFLQPRHSS